MASAAQPDPVEILQRSEQAHRAGQVNGRHYTTYRRAVRALRQAEHYPEAIALLTQLIDAVEAQARLDGYGIAPYYYDQLIMIYRKQKEYERAEAVRQRYLQQSLALAPNRTDR